MEYILNVRSFFALLYKEVSGKYILRFPHHGYRSFTFVQDDALPFLVIMMPYRIPSFRAGARMLCEKNGKQDSATERRIYYPDDVLPLSSLRQIFSVFTS